MPYPFDDNPKIPAAFLVDIGAPGAVNTSRLEVAMVIADGISQDDKVWKNVDDAHMAPQGWHWTDIHGQPITQFKRKNPGNLEEVFGYTPPSESAPRFPVPDGFTLLNVSVNTDTGKADAKGSGYDAVAVYNKDSGELVIVNHGLDGGSALDLAAVFADGGKQVKDAQKFLEETLTKIGNPAPKHVTLAGHSLGGVLADVQGVAMLNRNPKIDFHVITLDSIGSETYCKTEQVTSDQIKQVAERSLSIKGNGRGTALPTTHRFKDLFEDSTLGATQLYYDVKHDAYHFTAPIFKEVEQPQNAADKKPLQR